MPSACWHQREFLPSPMPSACWHQRKKFGINHIFLHILHVLYNAHLHWFYRKDHDSPLKTFRSALCQQWLPTQSKNSSQMQRSTWFLSVRVCLEVNLDSDSKQTLAIVTEIIVLPRRNGQGSALELYYLGPVAMMDRFIGQPKFAARHTWNLRDKNQSRELGRN